MFLELIDPHEVIKELKEKESVLISLDIGKQDKFLSILQHMEEFGYSKVVAWNEEYRLRILFFRKKQLPLVGMKKMCQDAIEEWKEKKVIIIRGSDKLKSRNFADIEARGFKKLISLDSSEEVSDYTNCHRIIFTT